MVYLDLSIYESLLWSPNYYRSDLDSLRLIHVDILTILRKVNLFKQQMISARVLKVLKFLQNINYAMRRDCAKKKIKANFIVNWRWLMCLRYNINRTNLFVMKCANAERCVKKGVYIKINVFAKIRSINILGCMYENTYKYHRFVSDVFLIVYFQFRTCSLHIFKS